MSPEQEKAFWEEMKHCHYKRADGCLGKCLDPQQHNLGCATCAVAAGLTEPGTFEEEKE